MRVPFAALGLFALAVLASVAAADVVDLHDDDFDEFIAKEKVVLVKFFAPWCGHCKKMKDDYVEAAKELGDAAKLVDVDATEEKGLASKFGIKGFPSLKLFLDGEFAADYNGGRTKDAMVAFIHDQTRVATTSVDDAAALTAALAEAKEAAPAAKLVVAVTLAEDAAKAFEKAAKGARTTLGESLARFFHVAAGEEVEGVKVKAGDVVVIGAETPVVGNIEADGFEAVEKAVTKEITPLVQALGRMNAQNFVDAGASIVLILSEGELPADRREVMTEAAKLSKDVDVSFVSIDETELATFKKYMGLEDKDPAIGIYNFKTDQKFVYQDEFTAGAIAKFAAAYGDGSLKPFAKSEPVPETNDAPVKIVVGSTWDAIVNDPTKDVLLEQYAPWCGHCKKLEPVYNELAELLKDNKDLVIAKMDSTANDAPPEFRAKGFPTIQFFPKGENKKIVEYQGDRSLEDLKTFLADQASASAGGSDTEKEEL